MLFGVLAYTPDGELCLEDLDGRVKLDMSHVVGIRVPTADVLLTDSRNPAKAFTPRAVW